MSRVGKRKGQHSQDKGDSKRLKIKTVEDRLIEFLQCDDSISNVLRTNFKALNFTLADFTLAGKQPLNFYQEAFGNNFTERKLDAIIQRLVPFVLEEDERRTELMQKELDLRQTKADLMKKEMELLNEELQLLKYENGLIMDDEALKFYESLSKMNWFLEYRKQLSCLTRQIFDETLLKAVKFHQIYGSDELKGKLDAIKPLFEKFPGFISACRNNVEGDPYDRLIRDAVEFNGAKEPVIYAHNDLNYLKFDQNLLKLNGVWEIRDEAFFGGIKVELYSNVGLCYVDEHIPWSELEAALKNNIDQMDSDEIGKRNMMHLRAYADTLKCGNIANFATRPSMLKENENTWATYPLMMLMLPMFHLMFQKNIKVVFDREVVFFAPIQKGMDMWKAKLKPDTAGIVTTSSNEAEFCSGVVELKVKEGDFEKNKCKAIFMAILQWKQIQMLKKHHSADDIVIPTAVVHKDIMTVYAIKRLTDTDRKTILDKELIKLVDKRNLQFVYMKLETFELSNEAKCAEARRVFINIFLRSHTVLDNIVKDNPAAVGLVSKILHKMTQIRTVAPSKSSKKGDNQTDSKSGNLPAGSNESGLCDELGLEFIDKLSNTTFELSELPPPMDDSGVLKARDRVTNNFVVVKYVSLQNNRDVYYLKKEARVLEKLGSNHFTYCLISQHSTDYFHVLVQNFCGVDSSKIDFGSLKLNSLKKYIAQALKALQFIHQKKIIHTDLSLKNICIDVLNEKLRLIDFEYAEEVDEKGESLSKISYRGTKGFTAPEMELLKERPEKVSVAVDVYSVGKVFQKWGENAGFETRCEVDYVEQFKSFIAGMCEPDIAKRCSISTALDFVQK